MKPSEKGGSFSSPNGLFKSFKHNYPHLHITRKQVEYFLMGQPSYTRNRGFRTHFPTRKIIVGGINELHQSDLIDMQQFQKSNNGVRFLLLVIDVFSKFIWIEPLKDKKAESVAQGFRNIYQKYSDFPSTITTDKGKEFHNRLIETFFKENNVHFYSSEGNTKAQFAERAIHTIKQMIARFMTANNTNTYEYVLADLVKSYNHTYKRSLGMSPVDVNSFNMKKVFHTMYKGNVYSIIKKYVLSTKYEMQESLIEEGDTVRIQLRLGFFSKKIQ